MAVETLSEQFRDALHRIEINGQKAKYAQEAHREVREVLERSPLLRSWGIESALIGSYARSTGIYPGRDVDIFAKLTALDPSIEPGLIHGAIYKVLLDHFGPARTTLRPRSVKVTYPAWDFSADSVPAVPFGERWVIPTRDASRWSSDQFHDRWIVTDPEQLSELTGERNRSPRVDGQGAYVPTVKLMRQAREYRLGEEKPGGLFFEFMTCHCFSAGVAGDSFAELFAEALRSVANQLAAAPQTPVLDPVLLTRYEPWPPEPRLAEAAQVFEALATKAAEALVSNKCMAAKNWREILGSNERGQCFPLPPGCDAAGRLVPAITANPARGSNQARGFA